MEHLRSRSWEAARTELEAALEIDPENLDALILLGRTQRRLGAPGDAVDSFQRAVELAPDRAEAQFQLGVTLAQAGNSNQALAPLQRAEELAPDEPLIPAYLGVLYRRLGRPAAAAVAYERARELDPDDGGLAMDVAVSWRAAGELEKALDAARRAKELLPNDPRPFRLYGELLLESRNPATLPEAPAAFRKAIENGQDEDVVFAALAESYMRLGLYDEAEDAFREAIDRAPEAADHWFNLGQVLLELKRFNEALEAFDRTLELSPSLAGRAQNMRGRVLYQLQRTDEALEAFRKASEQLDDVAKPSISAATVLTDAGDFETAESYLERAIEEGNTGADVWRAYGRLRLRQNRPADAAEMFRRGVEQAPEDRNLHYLLGQALIRAGKVEEGQRLLREYSRQDEDTRPPEEREQERAGLWMLQGRAFLEEGRIERAISLLERAAEARPDDPRSWRLLADAYAAAGDDEGVARARARLAELEGSDAP